MERKLGQPDTSGPGAAVIEREGSEQHSGDHMNENTLMSSRQYRDPDQGYRSITELAEDFEIRRKVDRQAMFPRGSYVVNSRMERYMRPERYPGRDPGEHSKNFPAPGNIEDQHLVRPRGK